MTTGQRAAITLCAVIALVAVAFPPWTNPLNSFVGFRWINTPHYQIDGQFDGVRTLFLLLILSVACAVVVLGLRRPCKLSGSQNLILIVGACLAITVLARPPWHVYGDFAGYRFVLTEHAPIRPTGMVGKIDTLRTVANLAAVGVTCSVFMVWCGRRRNE